MESIQEKREALIDRIEALPENQRNAVCWLIENWGFAVKLCKVKPLTEAERAQWMRRAMENDDALMFVLLMLERCIHADGMKF